MDVEDQKLWCIAVEFSYLVGARMVKNLAVTSVVSSGRWGMLFQDGPILVWRLWIIVYGQREFLVWSRTGWSRSDGKPESKKQSRRSFRLRQRPDDASWHLQEPEGIYSLAVRTSVVYGLHACYLFIENTTSYSKLWGEDERMRHVQRKIFLVTQRKFDLSQKTQDQAFPLSPPPPWRGLGAVSIGQECYTRRNESVHPK